MEGGGKNIGGRNSKSEITLIGKELDIYIYSTPKETRQFLICPRVAINFVKI